MDEGRNLRVALRFLPDFFVYNDFKPYRKGKRIENLYKYKSIYKKFI